MLSNIMMHLRVKLFVSLLFVFSIVTQSKTTSDIVNLKVQSRIDLTTHFALVKNKILFINKGPKVVRSYNYFISESTLYKIDFYNKNEIKLNAKEVHSAIPYFEVQLDKDVRTNETFLLICKLTFAEKIVPATKHRTMEENQLMKYNNNLRYFSGYRTQFCEIKYLLKNHSLVEVTQDPTHVTINNVIFVFQDTSKFDSTPVTLVFINNKSFFVIPSLHRTIDVNHYGKIKIQDEVVLLNNGSRLVGPYDIFLLEEKKALQRSFYTHLPASAENIRLSDILGINTATFVYTFMDYITLNFYTRYPLLGGWKTSYVLQYEVPTHEYMFTKGNLFFLQIRAIDYILNGEMLNNAVVKIILPEGARIINFNNPEILNVQGQEISCPGSLCVFGRPTIVMTGKDLFDNYITLMNVTYVLHPWRLLQTPFVIIVYLEAIFVVIICSRKYLL